MKIRLLPLAVGSFALAISGCTTTIHPPDRVRDPVRVVLLDYGYHASLAVPDGADRVTEHAFGEWGWYAENRTGWWRAPGILLWPRQGALGRRGHACRLADLMERTGAESAIEIDIERDRADLWRARMDGAWRDGQGRRAAVRNPEHQMEFVEAADNYWIFNTCNAAVASWLVELGCETSGWTIGADFKLSEPRETGQSWADTPP